MEEKTLLDDRVVWYKSKIQAFPGQLRITNQTISFKRDVIRTPIGGALGGLIFALKRRQMKDGYVMSEPLKDVVFQKGKRLGKKTYFLEVKTMKSESYTFLFDDELLSKIEGEITLIL